MPNASTPLYKRSPERGADIAALIAVSLYLILFYIFFFMPVRPKRMPTDVGEPTDHPYKYEVTVKRYLA